MFCAMPSLRLLQVVTCGLVLIVSVTGRQAHAADPAQIQKAVDRAKGYLLSQQKSNAQGSLACYSLVKAGVDANHPDIQKVIQEIKAKIRPSGYVPVTNYNYEAGVDAMLLEAVDGETYRPELESIAQFLIARQRPYGGWYYPQEGGGGTDYGDTSISQYAILGLWAASRAGVEVPAETWEKAAKWLTTTQRANGGFGYHPTGPGAPFGAMDTSVTMTAAGTGSLLVIRYILFQNVVFDDEEQPAPKAQAPTRRFGVLERLVDDKEKSRPKVRTTTTMTASSMDKSIKEGMKWSVDHFAEPTSYGNYYWYGIERMAALAQADKLGTHDWYDEGADELLRKQTAEGSWSDNCGPIPATALTILFLTKATAKMVTKPKKKAPTIGGGLLVGGRGLPDNLDAVTVKAGEVASRKLHGSIDELLAELEKSSGARVEAAQAAVVEAVQLEHPEQLIGQLDVLKRLATDKRVEVRRTAMWALGRTGNMTVAPLLIRGLSDVDESVMREASAALCILSRRPNGLSLPIDPTDGLAEDATNEQRLAHLDQWQLGSTKLWTDWYRKIRPYDERDDRTTLKRKQ
ncbi:MAG: HEAT repeat domain-containing protein [Planctomycetes bacterium]|nr:HEAT repeat domain-containing protein [Planctomycetota bacterium]